MGIFSIADEFAPYRINLIFQGFKMKNEKVLSDLISRFEVCDFDIGQFQKIDSEEIGKIQEAIRLKREIKRFLSISAPLQLSPELASKTKK
jgi:hypothetical protein